MDPFDAYTAASNKINHSSIFLPPLHTAVKKNDQTRIKELIANNINVNMKDKLGWTPLHHACFLSHYDIAQLLLKAKADPNIHENRNRLTPLHISCTNLDWRTTKLLLEHQANPNLQDTYDSTPLHLICDCATQCNASIAELLINHGANIALVDKARQTPLSISLKNHHTELSWLLIKAQILMDAYSVKLDHSNYELHKNQIISSAPTDDLLFVTLKVNTDQDVSLLKQNLINMQDNLGATLLMYNAALESSNSVEFLLSQGADPLLRNKNNNNVFDIVMHLFAQQNSPEKQDALITMLKQCLNTIHTRYALQFLRLKEDRRPRSIVHSLPTDIVRYIMWFLIGPVTAYKATQLIQASKKIRIIQERIL